MYLYKQEMNSSQNFPLHQIFLIITDDFTGDKSERFQISSQGGIQLTTGAGPHLSSCIDI